MHLALARERLLERSRLLRGIAVEQSAALSPALRFGDTVRDGVRWVRVHPEVIAAAAVALFLLRPRRVWRWGLRLWGGWRLLQQMQLRLGSGSRRS
ncbi:YqjK family protein [Methyloversatilis sp.]|uniref:YqjK family protein n=1 Tax=Methyloversatilis sp. TaxID=2569862 RepID=UPI0027364563|nr:YqjK family protein [Methyloversatilis sp.]MDP2869174.1 YqjK family protein [Methyloversatilis sp.]MDP3457201.1 YqjK family protein [Methyloversatilis sp.]MDP3576593.1 YqjK family protein [Methyloversatilis sp.]